MQLGNAVCSCLAIPFRTCGEREVRGSQSEAAYVTDGGAAVSVCEPETSPRRWE